MEVASSTRWGMLYMYFAHYNILYEYLVLNYGSYLHPDIAPRTVRTGAIAYRTMFLTIGVCRGKWNIPNPFFWSSPIYLHP